MQQYKNKYKTCANSEVFVIGLAVNLREIPDLANKNPGNLGKSFYHLRIYTVHIKCKVAAAEAAHYFREFWTFYMAARSFIAHLAYRFN